VERLKFAEVEQAHHAIDIGAGKEDCGYGRSRVGGSGREFGCSEELLAKIRGSIEEEPVCRARRDGDLSLRARLCLQVPSAHGTTVLTIAVPLGKAASGSGAEDFYAHSGTSANGRSRGSEGLELSVGVGADFAVEIDLFVLRGGPFHEKGSFGSQMSVNLKSIA
jgi:hypothetical protein